MKAIYILFLAVTCCGCTATKIAVSNEYEREAHSVFNFFAPGFSIKDTLRVKNRCEKLHYIYDLSQNVPTNTLGIEHLTNIFTKEDIAWIHKQNNDLPVFIINPKKISHPVVVLSHEKLKMFRDSVSKIDEPEIFKQFAYEKMVIKEYGYPFYTIFSRPVFTKNYTVAIIHCYSGGGEETHILKRAEGGSWKIIAFANEVLY